MNDQRKEIPIYAPMLFHRLPKITQMRDPLLADWNRSLIETLSPSELADLIDFSQMNSIFESFVEVIGLPIAIIDFNARVLASSKWQRLCMEFHRVNDATLERCLESDKSLYQLLEVSQAFAIHRCHNGLIDCASPIIIEGQAIANLCIGQFFLGTPDHAYFKQLQEEYHFEDEEYFKALDEVPIIEEEKLPAILNLMTKLAEQIAQQSLAEKRALAAYASVEKLVEERTRELQASHELLKKLSKQVPGIIYQYRLYLDGSDGLPYASEGIREIFEVAPDEVEKSAELIFARIHPEDIKHVRVAIQLSAANLSPWHDEYRVILPRQGLCWREGHAIPERLPDGGTLWHGFITDITDRKMHEQQLEHIAHYDTLTDLPNRALLADRLRQAMLYSQRNNTVLAVLYIDLDGFKAVNDLYGHDMGDELLVDIAKKMKQVLRDSDTLARVGGDEFIGVLADLELPHDFDQVLERLLTVAAEPINLSSITLQVSASIGVTLYPQDNSDADQLLRHADQAMYIAKQSGKNRYYLFDPDQDAALHILRERLENIRYAIDQNEFLLYYQPKINLKTARIIGAEALIRWQHHDLGLLLPPAFLPIIENHPISIELSEWVIDTALKQVAEWHRMGLNIPISVNIGAHHLQQDNFVPRLIKLLTANPKVNPNSLELEILGTHALGEMPKITDIVESCKDLGVRIALDDFGSNFSALNYLKRVPADILKIDQVFVRDMIEDPDDLAIVEGVIQLASRSHRQVIAEGVESTAHIDLLLSMGCELAQGFGIAVPMLAADVPGWVGGMQL